MDLTCLNNLESYIEYSDLLNCNKNIKKYYNNFMSNRQLALWNIFDSKECFDIYETVLLKYSDGLTENIYDGLFMGLDDASRFIFYFINIETQRIEEVEAYTSNEVISLFLRESNYHYLLRNFLPESLKQKMINVIISHYSKKY
jgi:hypothetical protein